MNTPTISHTHMAKDCTAAYNSTEFGWHNWPIPDEPQTQKQTTYRPRSSLQQATLLLPKLDTDVLSNSSHQLGPSMPTLLVLNPTEATAWRKDEKERKKEDVSPLGLHQVTDRLEKVKEQTKYKQYKVEKLRRRKLAGRWEECNEARNRWGKGW